MWTVNTSNKNKLDEFQKYLNPLKFIHKDIREPDADPLTIIQYKASQFENVIVDDVVLDIENENVGANVKWLLDKLPQMLGQRALFSCYLGLHKQGKIYIYKGECKGLIVEPRGDSFGFNNYFQPEGTSQTFGELVPEALNPRKLAVDNLLIENTYEIRKVLKTWNEAFQEDKKS